MADSPVRGIDAKVVRSLKKRALSHGRSEEAENRQILAYTLTDSPQRRFAERLMSIPNVGRDEDFERVISSNATAPARRSDLDQPALS
jgi:antitoxin FitA